MRPVLVSACLLGLKVRYDGTSKPRSDFLPGDVIAIPVCPEVLGGLPTPRPKSVIEGGNGEDVLSGKARVASEEGEDVTRNFVRGAEAVLKVAKMSRATEAYFKARSPSCDEGFGVAAALLKKNGISVHSVE